MCDLITALAALFVFFVLPAAADFDQFSNACSVPSLHQGFNLKTQCINDCLSCCSTYDLEIDLNNCVANSDGHLEARINGQFASAPNSCNDCAIQDDYMLRCICPDASNNPVDSFLDIRTFLVNSCGRLACLGHVGSQGTVIDLPESETRNMFNRSLHRRAALGLSDPAKHGMFNLSLHRRAPDAEDTTSFTTTTIPPTTTFMFTSTRTFTAGHGPPSVITTPPGISISTLSRTVIFPNTTSTMEVPLIVWPSTLVTFTGGTRASSVVRRDTKHAAAKRAPVTSHTSFHWGNHTHTGSSTHCEEPTPTHTSSSTHCEEPTSTSSIMTEIPVLMHRSHSRTIVTLPTVTVSIETIVGPSGTDYSTYWNYTGTHHHHGTDHGTGHPHHSTDRHDTSYPTHHRHNHTLTSFHPSPMTSSIHPFTVPSTQSTETSATGTAASSDSASGSASAPETVQLTIPTEITTSTATTAGA